MPLPWSKPPSEITCPKCGAKVPVRRNKNSHFQPKPYCDVCGWNVERARKNLFAQIRQFAITAALFAAYTWAITGEVWIMLLMAVWVAGFMGFPIIRQFRRIPASRPAPPPQPLTGFADLNTVTLEVVVPRLNIIVEALITVAATAAIFFLGRELNPAHRKFPGARHQLLLIALTIVFAAYQLIAHGTRLLRLIRAVWLERHVANHAVKANGRINESSSGTITYEFLDYANRTHHGSGRDYTMALYEDMPVTVLYDPDHPQFNVPLVGLQFHRLRAAPS